MKVKLNICSDIIEDPNNKNGYNNKLSLGIKSQQFWLPTNKNINNIELNNSIMEKTWFTVDHIKNTDNQFFNRKVINTSLFNSNPSHLRIKIISLNLSKNLKNKINEAISVTRAIYNKCVELCCRDNPISVNREVLRNLLIYDKESNILPKEMKAAFAKVPSSIRDEAICDFIKAYKIQIQLLNEKKIQKFEMHFIKKKKER